MVLTLRRLFVATFLLGLLALTVRNVTDPDIGWHLRTGEFILSSRSIPHFDFFSFTATGKPWITHEWLSQIVMYLVYHWSGTGGLVLAFALTATLSFVLLYKRCEGKPYVAAFVVLAAALVAAPFWGARPQTLSLLFTSAYLYILDRFRRENNSRLLLWLTPLTILWANSHGSFMLAPALIAIYLAGAIAESAMSWNTSPSPPRAQIGPLAAILALSLAVIVVNPNGFELYAYPFQTLTSQPIQSYIQEWLPPDFHSIAVQPFLVVLIATLAAVALARRRVPLSEAVLFLALTLASFRAARQISLWVFVSAPILSRAVSQLIPRLGAQALPNRAREKEPVFQILNWALLAFLVVAAVMRIGSVIADEPQAERKAFPAGAVDFLQDHQLKGPLFNRYDWGGYLIWRLFPQERVFIDGRSDLYGLTEHSVFDEYLKAYNGAPDWREPLDRYGIRLVIVDPQSRLAVLLRDQPSWTRVFSDDQAIVFARD